MSMVELSVVVPTFNRLATLQRALEALGRQSLARARYEVIVVDDGSTDGTAEFLRTMPEVRSVRQPRNSGPAAARNRGIRLAEGELILFLGDDTIARPTLLARHLEAHAALDGAPVAVLGYVPWEEGAQTITPLMRYLVEGSVFPQFLFHRISDPDNVPYSFFYTSNISLRRQFLLDNGLFDEAFRYAYGEDTELAYRLTARGLRIVYREWLVADHYHPTSYMSVRQRARIAGRVDHLMAQKHPELVDPGWLHAHACAGQPSRLSRSFVDRIVDPALALADRTRLEHELLVRAYNWALRRHQLWALSDALAGRAGV